MKTRIISGAVLAVVGSFCIVMGGPVLLVLLLFASLVGMDEFYRAAGVYEKNGTKPAAAWTAFAGCAAYYGIMFVSGDEFSLGAAALVTAAVLVAYVLTFPKISSSAAVHIVFGFFYVAVMLGFVYLVRVGEKGRHAVWLVFLSSWVADTCAYFAGRFFGKHKMSPVLSPKKTVEGAVGGIAGAAAAGAVFSFAAEKGESLWQFVLICALAAVLSIFGDLAASAVKRDRGIKDYGNLIPGHGGILDRFDSVIFTAPVIYVLQKILFGMI